MKTSLYRVQPHAWMVLVLLITYYPNKEEISCCCLPGIAAGGDVVGKVTRLGTGNVRFASQQNVPKKYWFQLRGSAQAERAEKCVLNFHDPEECLFRTSEHNYMF